MQHPFSTTEEVERSSSATSDVFRFILLIMVAAGVNYFMPGVVKTLFFLPVLYFYYKSTDEAFWLAFFLILCDGFFGFFGWYEAVIAIIPGLPEIEVTQLYIMLTIVKAMRKPVVYSSFYRLPMYILLIYAFFLILQGYANGLEMALNIQFRLVKWLIPCALFYSLPRLMTGVKDYERLFLFLFPAALAALGAQIFTIIMGVAPAQFVQVSTVIASMAVEVTEENIYRGTYSESILLITFFGALFFLGNRSKAFNPNYLLIVIIADFASVFLSATRGWVLFFGIVLFFAFPFVFQLSPKRILVIAFFGALGLAGAQAVPIIKLQLDNAVKRILTMKDVASGNKDKFDASATVRLQTRVPKVMKYWRQSPLTGWGFSDLYLKRNDIHVGNPNLLLHSGIVGALLMAWFFSFYLGRLTLRSIKLSSKNPLKYALRVFPIFFFGWFLLHSTSVQYFGFYFHYPANGIIQAIFLCLGGLVYELSLQKTPDLDDVDLPKTLRETPDFQVVGFQHNGKKLPGGDLRNNPWV